MTTSHLTLKETLHAYEDIPPDEYVVLRVEDTGPGISPEDLPRIFEPFFTRKNQTRSSGSGLGLAVVHGVVRDHQGFINLKSTLGKGTLFELYFPVTTEKPAPLVEPPPVTGGTENILIIDDQESLASTASRFLEIYGYSVTTGKNPKDGIETAKAAAQNEATSAFDVTIVDMTIGDEYDGMDTCETLRNECPDVKIIITSSYPPDDRAKALIRDGAGWLQKPFDQEAIGRAVEKQLRGAPASVSS